MTQTTHRPERLDIRSFAQEAAHIEGGFSLLKLERLKQDLYRAEPEHASKTALSEVNWSARGETIPLAGGAAQIWLHLQVSLRAPMQCQRCLTEVIVPVAFDRSFRFVKTEDEAMAQDDEAEEELLVMAKHLDLIELMEDEIIMALPMVPLHDVCPTLVKLASSSDEYEAALSAKPNAFAALGALKKKSP
jgi:uncharacterized protein